MTKRGAKLYEQGRGQGAGAMKIMTAVFPAVSSHQHVDDLQHGASVGQPALRRRRLPQQGRRRRGEGVVELGCRGGRRRGGRGAGGLGVPAVVAVAAVAVAGSRSRLRRIFGPHLCFKVLHEMSSYTCSLLSLPRKQGKDFQGTGILPELCSCYSGKASLLPPSASGCVSSPPPNTLLLH